MGVILLKSCEMVTDLCSLVRLFDKTFATQKPTEWLKTDLLMHFSGSVLGKQVRLFSFKLPAEGGAGVRRGGAEIQGTHPSPNWDSVYP